MESFKRPVLSKASIEFLNSIDDPAKLQSGKRQVSNTSYMTEESWSSAETVQLPEFLESAETLEFLEFAPDKAVSLFQNYTDANAEFGPQPASLKDAALLAIQWHPQNATGLDDDWETCLREMGISRSLIRRLMDPYWTDWRLRASAKEWVSYVIEERYLFLQTIDTVIGHSQKTHQHTKKLSGFSGPSLPSATLGNVNVAGPSKDQPKSVVATCVPHLPHQMEDHLILYKGGSRPRLRRIFQADGSLKFNALDSSPPGDFSGEIGGLYFAKQHQVAWRFAQWAHRLVDGNVVPIAILRVAFPNDVFASSCDVVGDQWKRFVWANRRKDPPSEDAQHLDSFDWIIGPICPTSNDVVEDLSDVSQLKVLRMVNQDAATQYWTKNQRSLNLNERCVGKVWIEEVNARGARK